MDIIEKLKALDLKKQDPNELIKVVHQLFPVPIGLIKIPSELSIFRARPNSPGKDFFNQSDITNPNPSPLDGRAHFKNQSIFYGSIKSKELDYGYVTAAIETSKVANNVDITVGTEELTIGRWDIVGDLWVQAIARTEDILNPEFQYSGMFEELRALYNPGDRESVEMFERLDYISSEFSKFVPSGHDYEYKRTACFANLVLQHAKIDGLMYPSVATTLKGLNVALKPSVVGSKIKLTRVLKLKLYKKETIVATNLKIAEVNPHSREFIWTDAESHEKISIDKVNSILKTNFSE